jgi:hypothetical protein
MEAVMNERTDHHGECAREAASPSCRRIDAGSLTLSLSAVLLGGLILSVAMREPTAQADMVNQTGLMQVMTARGDSNEDVLLILDGQSERLSVYRVENQASVELYKRYELPKVFGDARARAMGRK